MKKLVILSVFAVLTLLAPAVLWHATAISNPYKNDTSGEKYVVLSFDDGPDPRFTPYVLEILDNTGPGQPFLLWAPKPKSTPNYWP